MRGVMRGLGGRMGGVVRFSVSVDGIVGVPLKNYGRKRNVKIECVERKRLLICPPWMDLVRVV